VAAAYQLRMSVCSAPTSRHSIRRWYAAALDRHVRQASGLRPRKPNKKADGGVVTLQASGAAVGCGDRLG